MTLPDRSRLAAVILLYALTRLLILALYQPAGTDVLLYYEYVTRAAAGQTPYRDLAIEYPPLSWWTMALPATTEWETYLPRFRRLMFAFDAGAFALFVAIVRRRRNDLASGLAAAYVVTTAAVAPVLIDRIDAGLLLLLMLWAYSWVRRLEGGPNAEGWILFAYWILGVGIAHKLMPLAIVPVLLAGERGERAGALLKRMGAVALGAVPPFLVHIPSAGWGTMEFLTYHAARGIEIGSLFANVMWLVSWLGVPVRVDYRFAAFELVGPLGGTMTVLSTIVGFGIVAALCAYASRTALDPEAPGSRGARLYVLGCLALPVLILASKVLSPQYFVWTMPLMLLAAVELMRNTRELAVFCAAVIVLAVLTTVVYPIGFAGLRAFRLDVWIILTARNVLLVGLACWLVWAVVQREKGLA